MLGLHANWKSRSIKDFDRNLTSKLNFSLILIKLLALRNIITESKIKSFLSPKLKSLHDPMSLPGMKIAIKRLKKAIDEKENY